MGWVCGGLADARAAGDAQDAALTSQAMAAQHSSEGMMRGAGPSGPSEGLMRGAGHSGPDSGLAQGLDSGGSESGLVRAA
jgi:hypothetical protein